MPQRFPSQRPIGENRCAAFFVQFDPRVCWTGRGSDRPFPRLGEAVPSEQHFVDPLPIPAPLLYFVEVRPAFGSGVVRDGSTALERSGTLCWSSRPILKAAGLAQALNGSFTEAVQRDNKHVRTCTFVWLGKL